MIGKKKKKEWKMVSKMRIRVDVRNIKINKWYIYLSTGIKVLIYLFFVFEGNFETNLKVLLDSMNR